MKKYTVRIYDYYNNVIREFHHNKIDVAIRCARHFNRWWADVIETETLKLLYVVDKNNIEIDYRHTTLEKGEA